MTKKSHKAKDGKGKEEEWTWEENPNTIEAIKRLHEAMRKLKKTEG